MSTLYNIGQNQVGVIVKLDNHIDSKLRLAEMGLMPGADVRMIKKTPMGGPIQIKINKADFLAKINALFVVLPKIA